MRTLYSEMDSWNTLLDLCEDILFLIDLWLQGICSNHHSEKLKLFYCVKNKLRWTESAFVVAVTA